METSGRGGPATDWDVLLSNPTLLQPGDIVHMRWSGFPWYLVRRYSGAGDPRPTWANHSAIIVTNSPLPLLVEAMARTVTRQPRRYQHPPWWTLWRGRCRLVVHRRPGGLSPGLQSGVAAKALDYEGRVFGVLKIMLHALDFCLGGRYVFRRLARMDDYPICSWIVAYAYYRLIGLKFKDRPPNAASPDDIMDHCMDQHWRLVWADSEDTLESVYGIYPQARPS